MKERKERTARLLTDEQLFIKSQSDLDATSIASPKLNKRSRSVLEEFSRRNPNLLGSTMLPEELAQKAPTLYRNILLRDRAVGSLLRRLNNITPITPEDVDLETRQVKPERLTERGYFQKHPDYLAVVSSYKVGERSNIWKQILAEQEKKRVESNPLRDTREVMFPISPPEGQPSNLEGKFIAAPSWLEQVKGLGQGFKEALWNREVAKLAAMSALVMGLYWPKNHEPVKANLVPLQNPSYTGVTSGSANREDLPFSRSDINVDPLSVPAKSDITTEVVEAGHPLIPLPNGDIFLGGDKVQTVQGPMSLDALEKELVGLGLDGNWGDSEEEVAFQVDRFNLAVNPEIKVETVSGETTWREVRERLAEAGYNGGLDRKEAIPAYNRIIAPDRILMLTNAGWVSWREINYRLNKFHYQGPRDTRSAVEAFNDFVS